MPDRPFRPTPRYQVQASKLAPETETLSADIGTWVGENYLIDAKKLLHHAWNARAHARQEAMMRLDGRPSDEMTSEEREEYRQRARALTRDEDAIAQAIDEVLVALRHVSDVMRDEARSTAA